MWIAAIAQAGMSIAGAKAEQNSLKGQAKIASLQANRDEETQRRETRQLRGAQAAAIAENGLTPDGSTGMMADQDAANAELDALNIRYAGILKRHGLRTEANNAKVRGYALAGQQLLSGFSGSYTQGMTRAS